MALRTGVCRIEFANVIELIPNPPFEPPNPTPKTFTPARRESRSPQSRRWKLIDPSAESSVIRAVSNHSLIPSTEAGSNFRKRSTYNFFFFLYSRYGLAFVGEQQFSHPINILRVRLKNWGCLLGDDETRLN